MNVEYKIEFDRNLRLSQVMIKFRTQTPIFIAAHFPVQVEIVERKRCIVNGNPLFESI